VTGGSSDSVGAGDVQAVWSKSFRAGYFFKTYSRNWLGAGIIPA